MPINLLPRVPLLERYFIPMIATILNAGLVMSEEWISHDAC